MFKERIVFKSGKFTDFTGQERSVTFAALSSVDDLNWKNVSVGVAIQNPMDKTISEELGKTIAEGKARKRPVGTLYCDNKGFINTKVVEALLEQELAYFQQSPHMYISGYLKDKALYEASPEAYKKKFNL